MFFMNADLLSPSNMAVELNSLANRVETRIGAAWLASYTILLMVTALRYLTKTAFPVLHYRPTGASVSTRTSLSKMDIQETYHLLSPSQSMELLFLNILSSLLATSPKELQFILTQSN